MAMTSRKEEVRFDEHPGEDGRALGTADAGHVDQSQFLGEEYMRETQWVCRGDCGLVETQLGCRHHEPGSDPTSA